MDNPILLSLQTEIDQVYFDEINLDGGRSSQMMWKKQAGPSYDTGQAGVSSTYPVGNILSYISETSPVSGPLTYN